MSSYVVNKKVIDALVTAYFQGPEGYRWERPTYHSYITQDNSDGHLTESDIGRLLWLANHHGVTSYYGDRDDFPGPRGLTLAGIEAYAYERTPRMSIGQTCAVLSMYEYQSCDTDDWLTSPAFRFCDLLRGRLVRKLPDYDEPSWLYEKGA
jgi:hypothetical protein